MLTIQCFLIIKTSPSAKPVPSTSKYTLLLLLKYTVFFQQQTQLHTASIGRRYFRSDLLRLPSSPASTLIFKVIIYYIIIYIIDITHFIYMCREQLIEFYFSIITSITKYLLQKNTLDSMRLRAPVLGSPLPPHNSPSNQKANFYLHCKPGSSRRKIIQDLFTLWKMSRLKYLKNQPPPEKEC